MVAIVSGNTLGTSLTSLATLAQNFNPGTSASGNTGEQAFVNVANGNLVVQDRDELLLGQGIDAFALRTYNSRGLKDDDNGDNWSSGFYTRNLSVSGTPETVGSTVTRTSQDGAQAVYTWIAEKGHYRTTAGAGAHDTIQFDAGLQSLTWTDGDTGAQESYRRSDGKLMAMSDGRGNAVGYQYNSSTGLVEKITTATGDFLTYEYNTGTRQVKSITTTDGSGLVTRLTKYEYSNNRLSAIEVDLTPENTVDSAKYRTTYTYDSNARLFTATQADGSSLKFLYDVAGQLVEIVDQIKAGTSGSTTKQTSTFTYDLAGRKVAEKVVQGNVVYQDNHLAYDELGRLTWVGDGRANITMAYDKVGNRMRIQTHVINGTDAAASRDRYFFYDAMNRQVLADVNADRTLGDTGHRISYDLAGNKTSDTWLGNVMQVTQGGQTTFVVYDSNGNSTGATQTIQLANTYQAQAGLTTEEYARDVLGRIESIERDGVLVDERHYDKAGRLVQSGKTALDTDYLAALNGTNSRGAVLDGNGTELKTSQYDALGRLLGQRVDSNQGQLKHIVWSNPQGDSRLTDAAGNALGSHVVNGSGGSVTHYKNTWAVGESYRQAMVDATSNGLTGRTTNTYDGNGFLVKVDDDRQDANDRTIVNDASGKILYVKQATHVQRQLVVDGEVMGRYGEVVDDAEARSSQGVPQFKTIADFGFGFTNVAGNTPDMPDRTHVVATGDTMQALAQSYFGDSRLWYRIAEANGLASNADLRAGQQLKIPGTAVSGNAAGVFKPYDAGAVIGDTSPFVPMPEAKKSSFLKLLIVAVIAVVATIYGAGAIVSQLGTATTTVAGASSAASTFSAGLAALGGGSATVGGALTTISMTAGSTLSVAGAATVSAAVGSAIGSIASQAAGIGLGVQDKFNWKGVGLSAISGGLTTGLGAAATSGSLLDDIGLIGRAAAANAITQGIGVATGLQKKFDWRGVAASAVGAGVGRAVGSQFGDGFGARLATGLIAGTAAAAMRGGKICVQQVAVDAFGNALGSSLASNANGAPTTQAADPLGDFINDNMPAWQQRQANYDQIVGAFGGQVGPVGRSNHVLVAGGDRLRLSGVSSDADDEAYYAGIIAQAQARDAQKSAASTSFRSGEARATAALIAGGAADVRDVSPVFSDAEIDAMRQVNLARAQGLATQTQAALGTSGYETGIYSSEPGSFEYYRQRDGRVVVQLTGVGMPAEQHSARAQIIAGMNERLDAVVERAQDHYVQDGAQSSGWRYGLNAAGYVASEFFPRSVGQAAFDAIGGPVIGRALGAGVAQLNKLPILGSTLPQLGGSVSSWFGRMGGRQSSATPSAWAQLRATNTSHLTRAEKGLLGESRATIAYQRAGYQQMPSRLSSNNGFDGVFIKKGPDRSVIDIIINESKFTSTGRASLANTNMGKQMSPEWIDANIRKMLVSDDPAIGATARLLRNNSELIRTKANVLDPSGANRWNVLKLPE